MIKIQTSHHKEREKQKINEKTGDEKCLRNVLRFLPKKSLKQINNIESKAFYHQVVCVYRNTMHIMHISFHYNIDQPRPWQ